MTSENDNGYLAQQLTRLFDEVRKSDGKPYGLRQAAREINARAGEKLVSPSYLLRLRRGERKAVSLRIAAGIADLFGVEPGYFCDTGKDKP